LTIAPSGLSGKPASAPARVRASPDLRLHWFDKAAAWMDKHPAEADKLRQYRAEAEKTLGKG